MSGSQATLLLPPPPATWSLGPRESLFLPRATAAIHLHPLLLSPRPPLPPHLPIADGPQREETAVAWNQTHRCDSQNWKNAGGSGLIPRSLYVSPETWRLGRKGQQRKLSRPRSKPQALGSFAREIIFTLCLYRVATAPRPGGPQRDPALWLGKASCHPS